MSRVLRLLAVAIAVAAVWDPSWTVEQRTRPVVTLEAGVGFEDTATRVHERLRDDFTVFTGPVEGADARVVVGTSMPPAAAVPTFVVGPAEDTPRIADMFVPATAQLRSRIPVEANVRGVSDAEVELWVDGLLADRAEIPADAAAGAYVRTGFVPSAPGVRHVRLRVGGVWADSIVTVVDRPWRVLVYDARPSWPSTFLRRTLENDPRFEVAARVATSPRTSVSSGEVPEIRQSAALADVDVVIVGAPGELSDADADVLADYLRSGGGSVVAMVDSEPGALARIAAGAEWEERNLAAAVDMVSVSGSAWMQATELLVATSLPPAARPVAGVRTDGTLEPVIWTTPVGAGRLVVSGARDAWRYRAAPGSRFDEFWRRVLADAAVARPPALDVSLAPRTGRRGERVEVEVMVRDAALVPADDVEVSLAARLVSAAGELPVRLWPRSPGRFSGTIVLPEGTGAWQLQVEAAGFEGVADVLVLDDAVSAVTGTAAMRDAWVAAQGGRVFDVSQREQLAGAIATAVATTPRTRVLRPMRSPWWILPFALFLGAEWWMRRRRGDR